MTREEIRRRAPRMSIELGAAILGQKRRTVTVLDLSRTGCLVRAEAALDHGTILDIEFQLQPEPFVAKARVTESFVDGVASAEDGARYLVGLEFLGLPVREEARLRSFLDDERRRRRSADPAAV